MNQAPSRENVEVVRRAYEDFRETGEVSTDFTQLELRSLHDAGDKVVAILHQAGRSKSTGARVEMDFAQLFTVEGGLRIRMEMYDDPEEALAAAGLTG